MSQADGFEPTHPCPATSTLESRGLLVLLRCSLGNIRHRDCCLCKLFRLAYTQRPVVARHRYADRANIPTATSVHPCKSPREKPCYPLPLPSSLCRKVQAWNSSCRAALCAESSCFVFCLSLSASPHFRKGGSPAGILGVHCERSCSRETAPGLHA